MSVRVGPLLGRHIWVCWGCSWGCNEECMRPRTFWRRIVGYHQPVSAQNFGGVPYGGSFFRLEFLRLVIDFNYEVAR